jgi:diguanylate cyclase (GGDEF)-like protein
MTIVGKITALVTGVALFTTVGLLLFLVSGEDQGASVAASGVLEAPPGTISLFWIAACLVILSVGVSYVITRRIMSPLASLKTWAADIAGGRLSQPVLHSGRGEISEIATALESVMQKVANSSAREDSDHERLNADWEERTAQLSRTNTELSTAVREATETKDRLWQLAYYDNLTSLPNRHLFTEYLDRMLHLAQRNGEQVALLYLDLDDFKQMNDTFGHSFGDLLLHEFALRLKECVRESDVIGYNAEPGAHVDVSRFGGDEFTILLSQVDNAESAMVVAKRIMDSLAAAPMKIDDQEVRISTSIGIALAPGDASDSKGLLKAADTAMYYAKKGDKLGIAYYQDHMDEPRLDHISLKTDLREAVARNQLELHYQPQVDIRNGSVVGAEALLRWNHPVQGLIPPLQFIPLAEEMDIISELGKWTLREACRQLTEFKSMGLELPRVTVNISALQFNAEFISTVKSVLADSKLNPSSLQLELTEGSVITDVGGMVRALQELKELGVALSIDDFGTGFSPLSYLSRFPLDELKIDRRFVIKSQESENDANLVAGFIAMAACMKMRLVASGVESREQFEFLTSNGAHILQGYLFSEPLTAEKLKPLLAPWHFMEQLLGMTNEIDHKMGSAYAKNQL